MKELSRRDFGMTDKGAVVVIEKGGSPGDDGEMESAAFEVRHGVRTVGSYGSRGEAEAVAAAIAGAGSDD